MKSIFGSMALLLMLGGCMGDNAYDGENGLIGTPGTTVTLEGALASISSEVLHQDALALRSSAETLGMAIETAELSALREAWRDMARAWKRVEALYVADDLSQTMIDIPANVDAFHIGNTDLHAKLDRIFAQSGDLAIALFQNNTKSINALEYTLFNDGNLTERERGAAAVMLAHLQSNYAQIEQFYVQNGLSGGEEGVGVLINQLIDSAYKLKEWRIGEAAGLVVKYKDNPDAAHFEYAVSQSSLLAMRAVLEAHQAVMSSGLSQIAASASAAPQAEAITTAITGALSMIDAFDAPIENDATDTRIKALYAQINLLQTNYTALIAALNYTQKIIEADGD
ncbi:MAG: imelysin family protein [Campylobacterales bacterium]|nr:imelysin family protein [Campylobacterales bacterium]